MPKFKGDFDVHCIYCGRVTGWSQQAGRQTVCGVCVWCGERSEAREVAAGMRPWVRPLSFWVGFFHQTPMPDCEARIAQTNWNAEQDRIRAFNAAHSRARV